MYARDSGPSDSAAAITPHATNPQPVGRAMWVGTGGDLVYGPADGSADVTLKNIQNGTMLPICAKFVRATSTAADIVVLF